MSKTIYLNNYTSETFINNISETLKINTTDSSCELYINSHKVKCDSAVDVSCGKGVIRIFIDPNNTQKMNFTVKTGSEEYSEQYDIKYEPMLYNDSSDNEILLDNDYINNETMSFMLLRTNPKLSGNIKLVVDSSENMYLDTFKVNKTLSNKKYRKRMVSTNSYYSNDVRNVFGDIPSGDLYDIPSEGKNDNLDINNDIKYQYIDTYYYGVKNNFDKLYSENFSMLAPLWINKTLPDFFIVFRLDEIFDDFNLSSEESFNNIIKKGKIIKYYDIRKNSKIGNYLRNLQKEIDDYMYSTNITYNNVDFNIWRGISLRNGIITTVEESAYEINSKNTQVEHDAYITSGYERNDLLNPYLINFEFMFDDNENKDDLFKIKRYIGLYIKNNKLLSYFPININNTESFYSENNETIDNIDNLLGTIKPNYDNYVLNISSYVDNYKFTRILSSENFKEQRTNIPDKHLISSPLIILEKDEGKYMMHINIKKPLLAGEHIRIIDKKGNEYWEVVGASTNTMINNTDNDNILYQYQNFYNCYHDTIQNKFYTDNGQTIKANFDIFVGNNKNDSPFFESFIKNNEKYEIDKKTYLSDNEIIKKQIEQIVTSFNNMSNGKFKISFYDDNTIIFLSKDELIFERITADLIYDNNAGEFYETSNNSIEYFNNVIPSVKIDIMDDNYIFQHNSFKTTNNRNAQIINFCNYIDNRKNIIISSNQRHNISSTSLLYAKTAYIPLSDFKIECYDNNYSFSVKTIHHPYNERYIIAIDDNNDNNNIIDLEKIDIYNSTLCDFNVAGYIPIKDFNFNVLNTINDNKYGKKYTDANYVEKTVGLSFNIDNKLYVVTDGEIYASIGEENVTLNVNDCIPVTATDISGNGVNSKIAEYNLNAEKYVFTEDSILKNGFETIDDYEKYSLTAPYVCKWELNGLDKFGNKIKSTNKSYIKNNVDSYYLNNKESKLCNNSLFGYPCYRYFKNDISTDDKNFYIFNDINDIIVFKNDKTTLHDFIINGEGNIMHLLKNTENLGNIFSTLYYNENSDSLETIFLGKKLILSSNKKINLSKYNNYLFTVICAATANLKTNDRVEYIIDEKYEYITCIYYTEKYKLTLCNKDNYIVSNVFDSDGSIDASSFKFKRLNADFNFSVIINDKYAPFVNKISTNDASNLLKLKDDVSIYISTINLINDKKPVLDNNYTYSFSIQDLNLYGIHASDTSFLMSEDIFIKNKIDASYAFNINKDNKDAKKFNQCKNVTYEYIISNKKFDYKITDTLNDIKNALNIVYIKNEKTEKLYNAIQIDEMDADFIDNINLYYYSYKCNPEFIDMISFDNNVDNLFKKDLCFSNIKVCKVNSINQLFINNVCSSSNLTTNINNKFFEIKDYDITKCFWNNEKFNVLLNQNNNINYTSGYASGCLKSMFMGGVGLIINTPKIIISEWDGFINKISKIKLYNNSDDNSNKITYKFQLKYAILNYFLYNRNMINNWTYNQKEYITNFIENVLFNVFNINNKNNIEVFKLKQRIDNINKIVNFDINNIENYEKLNNIEIIYIDDYTFGIELPDDNYQYTIKYTMFK